MQRLLAGLAATALMVMPAMAQDWDSYFNMGTFGAGGGSDANGWLNFECADQDSGYATWGQAYMTMQVMDGVRLNKKALPADVTFRVGDGPDYRLPMGQEPGSTDGLDYVYGLQSVPAMIDFVAALRSGSSATASLGETVLASIELDGSRAALEFIEGCIQDGPKP